MASEEESKESLKLLMHYMRLMNANVENWKYVSTNAEYLDKKVVSDALEQVLSIHAPMMQRLQMLLEMDALTTLDPTDLI